MMRSKMRIWALTSVALLLSLGTILAIAQKKPATAPGAATQKVEPAHLESTELAKLDRGDADKVRRSVGRLQPVTIEAVVQEFDGSFESVAGHMDTFLKEFKDQKLNTGLKGNPIGLLIVYSEPHGNSGHMAVGLEVSGKLEPKAPLKLEHFTAPQAVRYIHTGEYSKIEHEHNAIHEQAKNTHKKGTAYPVVMRLLDDPRKVPANRARIEMVEKVE